MERPGYRRFATSRSSFRAASPAPARYSSASSDDQPRRYIGRVAAPEECGVSFSKKAQRLIPDRSLENLSNFGEVRAARLAPTRCWVAIGRQQYALTIPFPAAPATDPVLAEPLRRKNRSSTARAADAVKGAGQRTCARSKRSGSAAREHPEPPSKVPSASNTGAAEQLRSMCRERKCWDRVGRNRPLFDDTGADAIGAFGGLRTTHRAGAKCPRPVEQIGVRVVAAMVGDDAARVAEQKRVPGFANHLVKPIDRFLLRAADKLSRADREGFEELVSGEEIRRGLTAVWDRRDARARRTPPRSSRTPSLPGSRRTPARHRMDLLETYRCRKIDPRSAERIQRPIVPPIMDRASATVRVVRNLALGTIPFLWELCTLLPWSLL